MRDADEFVDEYDALRKVYDEAHHALNTEASNKEEVMRINLEAILKISGEILGLL
jgi:hypothetical protein